jgi:CRISPR-associated endonuclease/helicase Cas3
MAACPDSLWFAHSPRTKRGIPAQPYALHIRNVQERALPALESLLTSYCGSQQQLPERLRTALLWSTTFHDLGKLADENQDVLCGETGEALPYPHESAGALHCLERGQTAAAFAIHSHHQGLLNASVERVQYGYARDGEPCRPFVRNGEYTRTAQLLPELLERHDGALAGLAQALPEMPVRVLRWKADRGKKSSDLSALEMRLLLSLLVDADHGDTAHHYGQEPTIPLIALRWGERLEKLQAYVSSLGKERQSRRDPLRQAVYRECVQCDPSQPLYACDAPVGSGKTTAVMAYLLRAAQQHNLRRIFVVLPFTNIIQQSVEIYRKALVLDDEDPEQVVAENHHVAEFQSAEARGLTTLWRAPIVVTTAVQFFETLAASATGRLRKLHALPGSAVFIDEAHAAMPLRLWPSMWERVAELSRNWSCRFVLGSGSLPRFWEMKRLFAPDTAAPPAMLSDATLALGVEGERNRVVFRTKSEPQTLISLVQWITNLQGARLVVMNTVQSAAVLARALTQSGVRTLHLSTALTPAHRERILHQARALLEPENRFKEGWVLVATSCIEAGVDVSFDTALRERSSIASLIQIGGRVNRHGDEVRSEIWDFEAGDPQFTRNPALTDSRAVVEAAFHRGLLEKPAGDAMTIAVAEEFKRNTQTLEVEALRDAERDWEFTTVADKSRLIDDDTVTAVVDRVLLAKLRAMEPVRHTELIRGSVSIRRTVAEKASLCQLEALRDDRLYIWPEGQYDDKLLGIMQYLLTLNDISEKKLAMV